MLVRMDKEYSDITYVPASSLGSQIDNLCKRDNNKKFGEDEAAHLRPYYDYDERIKEFDESSIANRMKQIKNNPELMAQLKAEQEKKKLKEAKREEQRQRNLAQW